MHCTLLRGVTWQEKSEMARELKELRECVQELQEKQENAAAFMNNHEEAIAKIERKWEGMACHSDSQRCTSFMCCRQSQRFTKSRGKG